MADVMYVVARDLFCFLLLFVTVSVCKDRRQAVPPGNGHCVMYGICGVDPVTGRSVFCAYTGPPKPLTDPTARSVLDEWCPDFAHDTDTCCDALQLRWLKFMLSVPDQLLGICPACNHNFRNIFCNMVCSPKQSDFIAVTSTTSGHSVTAIKYDVSTTFADGMYNSCKEVRMPSSGERAISVLCGRPSDKCSPKRLLDYIGNTNTGQIPFSTQFNVTDNPDTIPSGVTLYPMNATAIPCSSPFGNKSKCSCRDCGAVPCPTTTQAPVPAYPCTNGPSDVIKEVPGYASLHLVIQRLGNHSEVKHFYPPPSLKSIMFQSVFQKEFLHQVLDLQTKIQTLNFTKGSTRVSLEDICLHGQVAKHCTVRSVLQYFQNSNHNVDKKVMDPYGFFVMADFLDHLLTCFRHPETVLDPPLNISCVPDYGCVVKPSQIFCGYDGSNYQNSTALVMTFVLKNPRVSAAAAVWTEGLRSFIKTWQDAHSDVKITFFEHPK